MTVQFSVAVRNARLDAVETAIGASAVHQTLNVLLSWPMRRSRLV